MNNKIEDFIKEVLNCMVINEEMKGRIADDLRAHISTASEVRDLEAVLKDMGTPQEVAKEFMDSIYDEKSTVIEKLIEQKLKNEKLMHGYFEYKSKLKLWGIPLVHIKSASGGIGKRYWYGRGGWHGRKPGVAKGIIAIGDISIGVLSLGALSIGGISLGGFSLGLAAFGGVAAGVLALGGVAVGILALGGLAIGFGAIGGAAIGEIAVGGYANGNVAIGAEPVGNHTLNIKIQSVSKTEAFNLIKSVYPKLNDWIIRIFTLFGKS